MDRPPQAAQGPAGRDSRVDRRPDPDPRPDPEAQGRAALNIGPLLVRTLHHFFPDFRDWLDAFPDPRDPARRTYHRRFLLWVGLFLFLCKLGSRRQIDFPLGELGTRVLDNLKNMAERLLESLRNLPWPQEAFARARIQIRFDSS